MMGPAAQPWRNSSEAAAARLFAPKPASARRTMKSASAPVSGVISAPAWIQPSGSRGATVTLSAPGKCDSRSSSAGTDTSGWERACTISPLCRLIVPKAFAGLIERLRFPAEIAKGDIPPHRQPRPIRPLGKPVPGQHKRIGEIDGQHGYARRVAHLESPAVGRTPIIQCAKDADVRRAQPTHPRLAVRVRIGGVRSDAQMEMGAAEPDRQEFAVPLDQVGRTGTCPLIRRATDSRAKNQLVPVAQDRVRKKIVKRVRIGRHRPAMNARLPRAIPFDDGLAPPTLFCQYRSIRFKGPPAHEN